MDPETQASISDQEYVRWKRNMGFLYDFFWSNYLRWPSLCCRWGAVLETQSYYTIQRLYYSERGKSENTIVVAKAEIMQPRIAMPEELSRFSEDQTSKSLQTSKRIHTPQSTEVNRIREWAQDSNLIAAKTDSSSLYVWKLSNIRDKANNPPDITLSGHGKTANESAFAIDWSKHGSLVASGDKDSKLLLWDIGDTSTSIASTNVDSSSKSVVKECIIQPRIDLVGHSAAVEDLCFHPTEADQLVSVGDDKLMLFWDTRANAHPAHTVKDVHSEDIHCIDWNPHDTNMLLTGSGDCKLRLFDRRRLDATPSQSACLHVFDAHNQPINNCEWSPTSRNHFASAADSDPHLYIWDTSLIGSTVEESEKKVGPAELVFKHNGHRCGVADFQWNPSNPWLVASLSEDVSGGTLQVWRMSDLLTRDNKDVLAELNIYLGYSV